MTDVVTALTDAAADLLPTFMAVGAIGIGVGAAVFALKRGWALVRGFSKSS